MVVSFARLFAAAFCCASVVPAFAQNWPVKPVRMLVPFPPGGGTDIQARLLSKAFQQEFGQNFIIDNRTGAGGLIAAQLTVDSPGDGYTLLFTSGSISVVTTLHASPRTSTMPIDSVTLGSPIACASQARMPPRIGGCNRSEQVRGPARLCSGGPDSYPRLGNLQANPDEQRRGP